MMSSDSRLREYHIEEIYFLESLEQLECLTSITRYKMISLLASKPTTGAQLARALEISRPKAHYHLKTLEKQGFVSRVDEILVNGILEKYYLARAKFFSFDKLEEFVEDHPGDNEYIQRWFRAKNQILINMLDISRENLSKTEISQNYSNNFEFDFKVRLTSEQVSEINAELSKLSERIRGMSKENMAKTGFNNLPRYQNIFLFLSIPEQSILHDRDNGEVS
jgi:DNA-binding transcriptional ArsR family regulator